MATKKVKSIPLPSEEDKAAALEKLSRLYEESLEEQMGILHNRFVAYISESRLPLHQALLVIKMIESEIMEQARKKYLGEP